MVLKDDYFTSKYIKIVSMFLVKRQNKKLKHASIKKLFEAFKKIHLAKIFLSLKNFEKNIS